MSGRTELLLRANRKSSSPSWLRAVFLSVKSPSPPVSAGQRLNSSRCREEEIRDVCETAFSIDSASRGKTHTLAPSSGGCLARQWAQLPLRAWVTQLTPSNKTAPRRQERGRGLHPGTSRPGGHQPRRPSAPVGLHLSSRPASSNTEKGWKKQNALTSTTFTKRLVLLSTI